MSPSRPVRRNPLALAAAAVLLVAAIAATFWVPIYARSTPKLGAFPFFYWYQLILVPAVAIVSWLAYLLLRPRERGERAAATAADEAPEAGTGPQSGPGAAR